MVCCSLLLTCILLSLIQYTSAAIPPKLYLSDSRDDTNVRTQNGFYCGHQPKGMHYHEHDVLAGTPYVSASGNKNVAIKYAKTTVVGFKLYYVYHVRTKGLAPGVIQSVAARYEAQNREYPYPDEDEYAVTGCVPWDNQSLQNLRAYFYSYPLPCRWVLTHGCIPEQARNFCKDEDEDDRSASVWAGPGICRFFCLRFL
ncbi:hypothetical protein MGG_05127 [Pyricularia oryzae 70-15]|uniref:Uncharacterized protein n=1 Tax=Pyricularia oryzae (strain 70-15 / ATCC MYA-4617 / FGSC 8958) TaxID=242507 RepID=G4N4I1_PYRO7|nr:uncharacterized protein MGG_05127 [Pyricularia oryzae 70-15]EHA52849.1 hypothetical protein MGG_05127 [Pyricularia oryzae 70-15]